MFRRVNKDEAIRNNWPCIFCDEWSHDFIHCKRLNFSR